ncbi:PQQ-binding-like beta-propeller repeat protein [Streptomyces sp. NPDC126499]|uniref:outer membrane protein assembly factor BamB family protein n=1 Tax=Streptomyces sp. NPDC126499 TaxID=3155314 RepID=UPI0033257A6C
MTQPPSNQPPVPGGFGAPDPNQNPGQHPGQNPGQNMPPVPPMPPQTPPAPPAPPQGAPQTPPPAQPGPYGYPQQAPAQPGPYGYPQQPGPYQQQPGPYGQQPGPYGQQPNPYGGYPTGPMQGPPPGGKNPFKGKPGVIVAAAAAALLVIGGGAWLAFGDGDGEKEPIAGPSSSSSSLPEPTESVDKGDGSGDGENGEKGLNDGRKDGEAKINWMLKNNVDLPKNGADVYGPWIVGDTVVKAMYKGIDGYSLADGSPKWHIDVPFELCAAPPEPSATGVMVFGYKDSAGDRAKCLQMQQVDLKTGKKGWTKAIPKPTGLFAFSDNTLAISGNTVTASGSSSAYGFSLADGRQLFTGPTSGCKPYAYAGGSKLIAASKCPSGDVKKESHAVSEVDPNTGRPKWSFKLQTGWEVDKVYSVDPIVVSATQREEKKWAIFSLTADGKERSQIQGGNDKFAPKCGGTFVIFGKNLQGCTGVAADANTFYMATETSYGTPNEVIAFDLNTGKAKWRSKAPGEQQMSPLRMEGSEVLLYVEPRYDAGGQVATLAPTGGAPKVLLQHQAEQSSLESSFFDAGYAYANGTFVIAAGRVSASNDKAEMETKTMMAYGK